MLVDLGDFQHFLDMRHNY